MSDQELDKFLGIIRALAESEHRIRKTKAELRDQESHNRQLHLEYEAERVRLVERELRARGLTWCTKCTLVNAISARSARLVFIREIRERSFGYGDCFSSFEKTKKLHRVCYYCRQQAFDRHGHVGKYDKETGNQESFFAFPVKREGEKTYFREFGEWKELPPELCQLDELPSILVDKLSQEWDLPSRLVDANFELETNRILSRKTVETETV